MIFTVDSLSVDVRNASPRMDVELHSRIAAACGLKKEEILSYRILRRSVDARKKPGVKLLYRLVVEAKEGAVPADAFPPAPKEEGPLWDPSCFLKKGGSAPCHPIVVGSGPAGLFAAYALALAGCRPLVIERGYDVERRKKDIDLFFRTRVLNPESNLLRGEGGAGTWSDGKLYTRIRDPRISFVLESFIRAGAREEIRYFSHPHIGSDCLPSIIAGIREKIRSLGGTFLWGSAVRSVKIRDGVCQGIVLSDDSVLEAPAVLLAPGHSARNLILHLISSCGLAHSLKGFQIGSRVEHPQHFINRMQYGLASPPSILGAAEYSMASRPSGKGKEDASQKHDGSGGEKGASTFCMCPGGEILPATSDPERLCTNGMSNSARSGAFANSAIVATVDPGIFKDAAEAFAFLDSLEKNAFLAGGSSYACPAQTLPDFLSGTLSSSLRVPGGAKAGEKEGSYSLGSLPARLDSLLPGDVCTALRRAVCHFEKIMPGFIQNGIFYGLETRVSSPVRFLRDPQTLESSVKRLYIGGEGAGAAGGITSAAVDGIRLAEKILENYS